MKRNILTALSAALVSLALAAPVHAYKIGGDVTQSAQLDNVITSSVGAETYARTELNSIADGANIGGSVKQTLRADNVITSAVGYKATACTGINVVGASDCSRR